MNQYLQIFGQGLMLFVSAIDFKLFTVCEKKNIPLVHNHTKELKGRIRTKEIAMKVIKTSKQMHHVSRLAYNFYRRGPSQKRVFIFLLEDVKVDDY
mgnify:CR=1 FL=1